MRYYYIMVDEKRKIKNARYYENNKERLQKLYMDNIMLKKKSV